MVHQHELFGEMVVLVQPIHIGTNYNKNTLKFRSSVWDMQGNLVSPGWKKFFNADEKPDLDALPHDISGGSILEKIDGSLAIFSLFKGNLVARTRGTTNAFKQDNGYEFEYLVEKYKIKQILEELNATEQITLLFEITTPTQRIVIDYGTEPDLWLIGAIRHNDYSYLTQNEVDDIGVKYQLKRPKRYFFKTMEELRTTVEAFRGVEGVCFYYNNDQCIRKFKGINYLFLHRAKSEVSSIEKIIDVYIDLFMTTTYPVAPTYPVFFQYLTDKFDFEIATMAQGHASRICDAMKEVNKIMAALLNCASECKNMPRRDAAARILQAYGSTGRSSIIFKLLDGKIAGADDWRKLLYQVLK